MEEQKLEKMCDNVNLLVDRQERIKETLVRIENNVKDMRSGGCDQGKVHEGQISVLSEKAQVNRALLWILLVVMCGAIVTNYVIPKAGTAAHASQEKGTK